MSTRKGWPGVGGPPIPLVLASGGTLKLRSATIDIGASLTVPSGNVSAGDIIETGSPPVLPARTRPVLALKSAATIDVRGIWINAQRDPATASGACRASAAGWRA